MTTHGSPILFDPNGHDSDDHSVSSTRLAATTEVDLMEDLPESVVEAIRGLVAFGSGGGRSLSIESLVSGGNNRVYLVEGGDLRYVAKWYYDDSAVFRERMRTEFNFLEHVWRSGVRCVPRPIACDAALHVAVYEYVPGRQVEPSDLTRQRIVSAGRFFAAINEPPVRASGKHLPLASDACFTAREHIASVDRRLERLSAIPTASAVDRDTAAFVAKLASAWHTIRSRLSNDAGEIDPPIPHPWLCISPSDFGFHNAMILADGSLCFLDFEYAGWDDPAKMIADFFAHPGVPVPAEHMEAFTAASLEPFRDREAITERAHRLRDVARIRWCSIALNEFLPHVASRRRFADPRSDPELRKKRQLEKAKSMLSTILL